MSCLWGGYENERVKGEKGEGEEKEGHETWDAEGKTGRGYEQRRDPPCSASRCTAGNWPPGTPPSPRARLPRPP